MSILLLVFLLVESYNAAILILHGENMKRIFCYGDSNTYGYDPHSYLGGRYPKHIRWTGLLEQAGWNVVNEGENGREIPTREWQFQAVVHAVSQAAPVDVVTVMLGGNDLLQNAAFTAEDVAARMERLLWKLTAHITGIQLLLIAPPPMRPGEWVNERRLLTESACLGTCYKTLAEVLGIGFADAGMWNVETAYDGVHFSEAGHAAFAKGLLNQLLLSSSNMLVGGQ